MLLTQLGRGTKLCIVVALTFTCLVAVHFTSYSLPKWRLPTTTPGATPDATPETSNTSTEASLDIPYASPTPNFTASDAIGSTVSDRLPCESLPGAEDVLVVMRTGATEINDKLPVHLNTTFRCYPHVVIFSDYEEEFNGQQVHDVLKHIPDEIKTTNEDFNHYQHVLEVGRKGLNDAELSKTSYESGPIGKNDNAGWRLDKWKFLPMINQTLALHPDRKWYVFVEPDTYLVWSSLLQWIPKLDATSALYFGSEVQIGDDVFAHGGSAFLMSKPAMEKGAQIYQTKASEWHDWTAGHWAGDCVLGRALHEAGVDLTWSWPMFQGGNPSVMKWQEEKLRSLWCAPAISYHHFNPDEVRGLWNFEQDWIRSLESQSAERGLSFPWWHDDMSSVLHHRDVFKSYVLPNMTSDRNDWNNNPEIQHGPLSNGTVAGCQATCEADHECLQYALGPNGCSTGVEPKMGQSEEGVQSGWMLERVERWMHKMDHCRGQDGWSLK